GAVTTGQSNYSLVVVGLIGLAALGFGLKMIVGAMR
ncbi:LPXTG cell wall anchor domain-containing protein, partial [Vibrio vulnificus]